MEWEEGGQRRIHFIANVLDKLTERLEQLDEPEWTLGYQEKIDHLLIRQFFRR
jgi:hypothetical protein